MKYFFYSDCVSWPKSKVNLLDAIIDEAITITRKTFLKHTHSPEYEEMINDNCTDFYRSKLLGVRVYYFRHSAIEYIFTKSPFAIIT